MDEEDTLQLNILDPSSMKPIEGNQSAGQFKHIKVPDDIHDLYQSIKKLDRWQREVVTQVITYSRDVVKARNRGEKYPQPLLLMVHGGAGAGISSCSWYIITLVCQKLAHNINVTFTELIKFSTFCILLHFYIL